MHVIQYPYLRKRDRGSGEGRCEIVISERETWEESQATLRHLVERLGLAIVRRIEGPDAWLWDVQSEAGTFIVGYDDFPCETTLYASEPRDDAAVERIFADLVRRQ